MSDAAKVEIVRGDVDDSWADRILRLWAEHGLAGEEAHRRLPEIVCALTRGEEIIGLNSVHAGDVKELGGRSFWLYRTLLTSSAGPPAASALLAAACEVLNREFDGSGPVGVCLQLQDPSIFPRHEEAYWPELGMIYAGYLPDGRQLRVRYFDEARI